MKPWHQVSGKEHLISDPGSFNCSTVLLSLFLVDVALVMETGLVLRLNDRGKL
jgi:hypothetical protein